MQPESAPLDGHAQVLVVDDQLSTSMLVHAILGRAGYRVDECASGCEAIDALSKGRYDLIVLDLNLPDMSGLDLMRDRQAWGSPPVLGMTSGVTPDRGLITAIVAGFLISALGGSRVQIGGPTGAFVVIVSGIVAKHGVDGLIVATMLAGALLVLMGAMKLGGVIKFVPQPVVIGFTSGIALIIFTSQVRDLLGLNIAKMPSEFLPALHAIFDSIRTISPLSAAFGFGSLIILAGFRNLLPRIPGAARRVEKDQGDVI